MTISRYKDRPLGKRRNYRTEYFTIPLTQADKQRLDEAATFLGVSKAEMARDVILKWLDTDFIAIKTEELARTHT